MTKQETLEAMAERLGINLPGMPPPPAKPAPEKPKRPSSPKKKSTLRTGGGKGRERKCQHPDTEHRPRARTGKNGRRYWYCRACNLDAAHRSRQKKRAERLSQASKGAKVSP